MKKLTPERDTVKYLHEKIKALPGGDQLSEDTISSIAELISEVNASNFDQIFSKIAEIDELKKTIGKSEESVTSLEKLVKDYKDQADKNKENFKDWHKKRDQEQTKIIGKATDALNAANQKISIYVSEAEAKEQAYQAIIKQFQSQESSLVSVISELQSEISGLRTENSEMRAEISELGSKLNAVLAHSDTVDRRLGNIEQGNRSINDKLDSVIPVINQKLNNLNTYVQQLNNYVGQLSQLTEQATGAVEGIDEMFTSFSETFSESIQSMENLVDEIKTSAKFAEDATSQVQEVSNKLVFDLKTLKTQISGFLNEASKKAVEGLVDLYNSTETNIITSVNNSYVDMEQKVSEAIKSIKNRSEQKVDESQSLVASAITNLNKAIDSFDPEEISTALNSLQSAVDKAGVSDDGKDLVDNLSSVVTIVSKLQNDVENLVSHLSQETDNVVGGEE